MTMKYQIDDSYIDDTPSAFLYQRIMDCYPKSAIGCFIINDDWNEHALLELKEKSEAWFLGKHPTIPLLRWHPAMR